MKTSTIASTEVAGYTTSHALLDLSALCGFVCAMTLLLLSLIGGIPQTAAENTGWLAVPVLLAAVFAADFVSGLVHFLADNFGHAETPVLGRLFIFPFREHHVDPKAITRHGYLETNGANCLISIPVVVAVLCFTTTAEHFFLRLFVFFFLAGIFFTNQVHKWAHSDSPPRLIRMLQRWRIILSPENHSIHHAAPHDKYYCITGGWLNLPLTQIHFFTGLKRLLKKPLS